jgi:hypothetical protein
MERAPSPLPPDMVSVLDPETRVTLKLAGISIMATCLAITLPAVQFRL